jgi:transcription elongation factor GreB
MSRAFVSETDGDFRDDDAPVVKYPLPPGTKNYMTPEGEARMREELARLAEERSRVAGSLARDVAAKEGDRERVIAVRKRLREIDRRRQYLSLMMENGEVVVPGSRGTDRVLFGARVTIREDGVEETYRIVGVDEADPQSGTISWRSPLARALLSKRAGERATLSLPGDVRTLEILRIEY